MRLSFRLPVRACALIPLSLLPLTGGCAGTLPTPVILTALQCGPLIPPSYRSPVRPVPLLKGDATVADALDALDGQTMRLEQANGRTADVIAMTEACDARSAQVAKQLRPRKWWPFQ